MTIEETLVLQKKKTPSPLILKVSSGLVSQKHKRFKSQANIFLICLQGEIKIENKNIDLQKPSEACVVPPNHDFTIIPNSESCALLFVMDQTIPLVEKPLSQKKQLLQMPTTTDFLGMKGCVLPTATHRFLWTLNAFTSPITSHRLLSEVDIAHINLESVIFPLKGQF